MSESGPQEPRNNGKKTKPVPPVEHRFKAGNPGRPKGARNKLGEAFLEDMLAAWEAQGPAAIRQVLKDRPAAFLKIVSDLLPKDMNINVNHLDGMTDDQLLRRLSQLTKIAAPILEKMTLTDDDSGPTASRH